MDRKNRLLAVVLELLREEVEERENIESTVELASDDSAMADLIGSAVIIRTVTYHYVGRLVAMKSDALVLEHASWVGDSGRWAQALSTGSLSEVEPYPDRVMISRGAIVDLTAWAHDLPRVAK